MAHDPLSPAEALRTRTGAVLATVSLLVLVYSLLIVGRVLFGVVVVLALSVGPYISYRLFAALDALADGAQRIADAREREAERGSRFGSVSERAESPADRVTERERER
ncbi:hypothetical protein [Halorubrum yunnanense]|uniref:DUF4229 domain-containing protein n=1 Tax=Halorubrum yunnanense TaxID=1526162 RepID=A0ABD5YGW7_9EURY|nr:hypothetical protein [Halorubrum yunnanense]